MVHEENTQEGLKDPAQDKQLIIENPVLLTSKQPVSIENLVSIEFLSFTKCRAGHFAYVNILNPANHPFTDHMMDVERHFALSS